MLIQTGGSHSNLQLEASQEEKNVCGKTLNIKETTDTRLFSLCPASHASRFLCHVVFVIHLNPKYSCYSHLHEDSEEDDGDDGSEEQVLDFIILQQEPQWEGYGTSQATVGNNELILFGQLHNTEFIDEGCEPDDSWNTQKKKELISSCHEFIINMIISFPLLGLYT